MSARAQLLADLHQAIGICMGSSQCTPILISVPASDKKPAGTRVVVVDAAALEGLLSACVEALEGQRDSSPPLELEIAPSVDP